MRFSVFISVVKRKHPNHMKRINQLIFSCILVLVFSLQSVLCASSHGDSHEAHASDISTPAEKHTSGSKPSPDVVIQMLKEGNKRFYTGNSTFPHLGPERFFQAGTENQGDHAYATVISCSDSRVPVELIFDAGIMDIFVIRVAGNVCDTDELGSIEYGLAHVNTPVLVVLGHTQCGAVTAVTHELQGHGHKLEKNIPPLVDNIVPAVKRAMHTHSSLDGDDVIPFAIKENVWQGVRDLFERSPDSLRLVKEGRVKVVGAIYDVATGKIEFMPQEPVLRLLAEATHEKPTARYTIGGRTDKVGSEERERRFSLLRDR